MGEQVARSLRSSTSIPARLFQALIGFVELPKFSNRTVGLLAIILPFWFALIYFIMSTLRTDYSHATKALSELGSLDAPNRWVWNIAGFMIPGFVIALLGAKLGDQFRGGKGARLVSYSLIASGLLMSMSGVFPGDFENRTSFTMIMHAIGSLGSFVAFLICGFSVPWILRRHSGWRAYAYPSLALVLLSIATGFLRSGEAPGIGQRLGVACFFAWIGLIGIGLFRNAVAEQKEN